MLSTHEYLLSWGMYLLGTLGLMVVWWRMTRRIPVPTVRNMLLVSALVALVMPYPVPGQESFLAPALMMTFIEGLFFEDQGFAHAGIPLLIALALANTVYLICDLTWQFLRRKREPTGDEPLGNE
ncbi:hypothetical protein F6455_17810 [Proteobacteria bacterium 005FR1]|nr:hypothetical protein [Proteobacteria bacterium 005FR1]